MAPDPIVPFDPDPTEDAWQDILGLPDEAIQGVLGLVHEVLRDNRPDEINSSLLHRSIMERFLKVRGRAIYEFSPELHPNPSRVDWNELADRFLKRHKLDYVPSESTDRGEMLAALREEQRRAEDSAE